MPSRRALLTGLTSSAALSAIGGRARAQQRRPRSAREVIAVLGTGHFGGAIGPRLTHVGHTIIYGSPTPAANKVRALVRRSGPVASCASLREAVSRAAIVVFAVPWAPVKAMLPKLGELTGKLLIDPMIANPRMVNKLPFPPDSSTSVAEQLQAWVPGAQVVSALSTIWYRDLADPARCGGPVSIPIAGNNRGANERVARLISQIRLDPVIIGNLAAARYTESLLWMEIASNSCIYNRGTKKLYEIYMRRVPL